MMKKYKESKKPFKWKHFKGDIIFWLVRWYDRYALSYGDLKERAAERGMSVERSTIWICRWVHEYGPEINKQIKPYLKVTNDSWKVDETYVKIKRKWYYLYREIDKSGQTLGWMLSQYRNKQAAKRFFKKVLDNHRVNKPRVINVDKNAAFPSAHSELQDEEITPKKTWLRQVKYLNNRIENDHKFIKRKSRYRQWYQSFETAAKIIDGMEAMRMLQKGQVKFLAKGNLRAQNDFMVKLFDLAA